MTESFQTDGGRTLEYTLSGSGPMVVLIPGGPGIDPAAYYDGTVLGSLTHVVLHPRGTAKSDPPDARDGYRIDGYVDDLEQLRRRLGDSQLSLYGSSHGASIALAYAAVYPEHVQRMVLAGGPARMDAAFMADLESARARFAADAPDGAARLAASDFALGAMRSAPSEADRQDATRTMIDTYVARPTTATDAYLDALSRAPMNNAATGVMASEMMGGLDLLARAHEILAPALIITGDLDVRVPSEHMEMVANTLVRADLIRLSGAGHLPHIERPAEWTASVASFLSER